MKKTNLIIAIVLLVLTVIFIKIGLTKPKGDKEKKDKTEKKVDAFVVMPSLLNSDITVTGQLAAYNEVDLKNEMSGRVVMVNLPEGRFVKKGTLLIKLYDDDLKAALSKLKAHLHIYNHEYHCQIFSDIVPN